MEWDAPPDRLSSFFCIFLQSHLMTIERTHNEIIIRLPDTVNVEHVQRLINYLMYQKARAKSQAKQEDIDALAREANRGWWERNKHRFEEKE